MEIRYSAITKSKHHRGAVEEAKMKPVKEDLLRSWVRFGVGDVMNPVWYGIRALKREGKPTPHCLVVRMWALVLRQVGKPI